MFDYIRDKLAALRLKARHERLVQEQLVALSETNDPVIEDSGHWHPVGELGGTLPDGKRQDLRSRARQLVLENPHARNILRLMESYVTGSGFRLNHQSREGFSPEELDRGSELSRQANRLWKDFLTHNVTHYSFQEHARRTWRDGECFIRRHPDHFWPPVVRFLDPEEIGACRAFPGSQGILNDPDDTELPTEYLRIDPLKGDLVERIPADEILHTRHGVDSNEKRGVTMLAPILNSLKSYEHWVETELQARKLQSSIVLWRKVQGSPHQIQSSTAPNSANSSTGTRSERFQPGSILTTNQATEIKFLQPDTNFGDAVPLGRMLLLSVAAGVGLPEFMLTSDASNSNYASTMVAEGPAVKFFQSEQLFFTREFERLWKWVMRDAIEHGLLEPDFFDRVEACWTFPQLVTRDRPRERAADAQLVELGVLSKAEVARRDGVEPERMRAERDDEAQPAVSLATV